MQYLFQMVYCVLLRLYLLHFLSNKMLTNIFIFSTVQGKPYKNVEVDANEVDKQYNNKFNNNSAMDRIQYNDL